MQKQTYYLVLEDADLPLTIKVFVGRSMSIKTFLKNYVCNLKPKYGKVLGIVANGPVDEDELNHYFEITMKGELIDHNL